MYSILFILHVHNYIITDVNFALFHPSVIVNILYIYPGIGQSGCHGEEEGEGGI